MRALKSPRFPLFVLLVLSWCFLPIESTSYYSQSHLLSLSPAFFLTIEIDCGEPGALPNGWLENSDGGTRAGASVIFRCYDNMTLIGATSSLCHTDGKWRYPVPSCFGGLFWVPDLGIASSSSPENCCFPSFEAAECS